MEGRTIYFTSIEPVRERKTAVNADPGTMPFSGV